jgi:hypothetical protein
LLVGGTIFSLAEQWFGIVIIVGLLWLHHIQFLANVTMATIAIGKVGKLVPPELVLRSRMILCAF